MIEGYRMFMWWVGHPLISTRFPTTEYTNVFYDQITHEWMEKINKYHDKIQADIEDIDEDTIIVSLPRIRTDDALKYNYPYYDELLQREVAKSIGHYPFNGDTMILERYETVEHYKTPNGRIGFKDLVLCVHGIAVSYDVEIQIRILDTKGMKWIVGWRRSKQ